ncbi:MAG TPA: hypothetical protein VGB39_01280 [Sphingomicrobium sp.]|jgi:hypothetical protein
MDDPTLSQALERAERAAARIERALAARSKRASDHADSREQALRSKVREAVAELDSLIRTAEKADG